MPRFAFTDPSIGSTTTVARPSRSEPAAPELLRDEHEVLVERGEPLDDRVLGRLVDRSRVVSALAPPQHGLALGARRQLLEHGADVGDAEPAGLEPRGHRSSGWKTIPESGFGKKYVLFCGMRSPRRATANTSSTRGSRRRNATSAAPPSTGRHRLVEARRVRDAVEPVAVDELGVELALLAAHELDATPAIRDRRGDARAAPSRARGAPRRGRRQLSPSRRLARSGRPANTRCVGKTRRPASCFDTTSAMIRIASPVSRARSTAALVAMVTVGDEELARGRPPAPSMRQSARSVDLDVRRGRRSLDSRSGVGRARRSARAAHASRAGAGAARPGCARASARAAGPFRPRTARRGATRSAP